MSEIMEPRLQQLPEPNPAAVVKSPNAFLSQEEILKAWSRKAFDEATPEPGYRPSLPRPGSGIESVPRTFRPPRIDLYPYSALCKINYQRDGKFYAASGWIVTGNTGVQGIITSGHVVYKDGHWAHSFVIRRGYCQGSSAETFYSNQPITLDGWVNGTGLREFWDIGALIPTQPIPAATPALAAVWNYNYSQSPADYFYDAGYPGKPANGYPFDGESVWQSDGPLIKAHRSGNQTALEAYNAMEQGSSGSPWLIYDPIQNSYRVAGIQASGWDNYPWSYSPYFDQRNIVVLLSGLGIIR